MTIKGTHADSKVSILCQVIPYGIPRMQYWHCNLKKPHASCLQKQESCCKCQPSMHAL